MIIAKYSTQAIIIISITIHDILAYRLHLKDKGNRYELPTLLLHHCCNIRIESVTDLIL